MRSVDLCDDHFRPFGYSVGVEWAATKHLGRVPANEGGRVAAEAKRRYQLDLLCNQPARLAMERGEATSNMAGTRPVEYLVFQVN